MNVLQVSSFFKPSWESGGVARFCHSISTALDRKGHNVTVYTTDGYKKRVDVPTNQPIDIDGVQTYYFRNISRRLLDHMIIPTPWKLPLVAFSEITEFDLIHIHEHRSPLAAIVATSALYFDIPYVVQAHGSLPYETGSGKLKRAFDTFGGQKILSGAARCIALTPSERSQYVSFGIPKELIRIVPNGIDPQSREYNKTSSLTKPETSDPVFLYLGRLHKRKGLFELVDAFENIQEGQLWIAGPDNGIGTKLRKKVAESRASERIDILGYLPESEKESVFQQADVFVLPSIGQEGFPTTILEAGLHTLPLLVSNKCNAGFVEKWNAGIVSKPKPSSLADSMRHLLDHPNCREKLGANAECMVKEEFTWENATNRLISVYNEITGID